jgi:gas vesicle protein GvpA/GvpJ/GvpM family
MAMGVERSPVTEAAAVLAPDRGSDGALSRLVEVLLDKGVVLDLDLLVTVAEVPLIAVNLRAMVAGVETMVEYGVPGSWSAPIADADRGGAAAPAAERQDASAVRATASFAEQRVSGTVWRPGVLTLGADGILRWQGDGDRRPALLTELTDILTTERVDADAPDRTSALRIRTEWRDVQLAVDDTDGWIALLGGSTPNADPADITRRRHDARGR